MEFSIKPNKKNFMSKFFNIENKRQGVDILIICGIFPIVPAYIFGFQYASFIISSVIGFIIFSQYLQRLQYARLAINNVNIDFFNIIHGSIAKIATHHEIKSHYIFIAKNGKFSHWAGGNIKLELIDDTAIIDAPFYVLKHIIELTRKKGFNLIESPATKIGIFL